MHDLTLSKRSNVPELFPFQHTRNLAARFHITILRTARLRPYGSLLSARRVYLINGIRSEILYGGSVAGLWPIPLAARARAHVHVHGRIPIPRDFSLVQISHRDHRPRGYFPAIPAGERKVSSWRNELPAARFPAGAN